MFRSSGESGHDEFHAFDREELGDSSTTLSLELDLSRVHEGSVPVAEYSRRSVSPTGVEGVAGFVQRKYSRWVVLDSEGEEEREEDAEEAEGGEGEEGTKTPPATSSSKKGKKKKAREYPHICKVGNTTVDGEVNSIGSSLTSDDIYDIRQMYGFPVKIVMNVPSKNEAACSDCFTKVTPNALVTILGFWVFQYWAYGEGTPTSANVFHCFYRIQPAKKMGLYYFYHRPIRKGGQVTQADEMAAKKYVPLEGIPTNQKEYKDHFFYVKFHDCPFITKWSEVILTEMNQLPKLTDDEEMLLRSCLGGHPSTSKI